MPSSCDLLLTNATVLTMDAQFTVHRSGAVAIAGDSIAAVGPAAYACNAAATIDCAGRVVMPGLINAHTHVPMALLRGLADDLRLDVWLMGYMMPVEREFVSPDFVRLGTGLGCAEMIRSGVTCFADMYYFEEAVAEATAAAGMRALCAQTVLRYPAPDATSYEDSLARARAFIDSLAGASADRARRRAAWPRSSTSCWRCSARVPTTRSATATSTSSPAPIDDDCRDRSAGGPGRWLRRQSLRDYYWWRERRAVELEILRPRDQRQSKGLPRKRDQRVRRLRGIDDHVPDLQPFDRPVG